ncbi:hypothetical protein [Rhodococcus koreensis]|uniref:hypothetical protein n=1 Tax=Rhodococcus koreensis TaxID=99653 RepID=UPI0036D7EA7A
MTAARKADDLVACMRDAPGGTGDTSEFRRAVLDGIRARIPFDRGGIAMVDPATLMLTPATWSMSTIRPGVRRGVVAELEWPGPYANTYGSLARTRPGVHTIRDSIEGEIREALPYVGSSRKRWFPKRIRGELDEILSADGYQDAAATLGARLRATHAASAAADRLSTLIVSRG